MQLQGVVITFLILFACHDLYGQKWTRQSKSNLADSIADKYAWHITGEYHSAGGNLTLYKNGRYKYYSYYPRVQEDSSEGNYRIYKNTLILNSDFQPGNVPVKINCSDSPFNKLSDKYISMPRNLTGDTCYTCSYNFNNDSTRYFPSDIYRGDVPKEISSLKIHFLFNEFSSGWIPVTKHCGYIEVILLTEKNFDDYINKVFTNYKFRMNKNELFEIKK
ncbi:MAG: hypothetical protein SFU87_07845 [Chitinophagaceae bacterium]|nr:hypothetical protein [Chitinophagaceae bacterium]